MPEVEALIEEEASRFDEWLKGRSVLPVLIALRGKAKRIAEIELERGLHQLDQLSSSDQEKVFHLVHRVVNKVLHDPTVRLKKSAAEGNGLEYAHVLRELFALDNNQDDAAQTESVSLTSADVPQKDVAKNSKQVSGPTARNRSGDIAISLVFP